MGSFKNIKVLYFIQIKSTLLNYQKLIFFKYDCCKFLPCTLRLFILHSGYKYDDCIQMSRLVIRDPNRKEFSYY